MPLTCLFWHVSYIRETHITPKIGSILFHTKLCLEPWKAIQESNTKWEKTWTIEVNSCITQFSLHWYLWVLIWIWMHQYMILLWNEYKISGYCFWIICPTHYIITTRLSCLNRSSLSLCFWLFLLLSQHL